jgi:hypothetical protein
MKIPTTPAMRRLNLAVERADLLLGPAFDRSSVPEMVAQLMRGGWAIGSRWSAAVELVNATIAAHYPCEEQLPRR